ncbi:cation transport ATPase [Paenibacillus sp. V4I3]|uniref:hypothetical protein n=1 Tax=Paenibacillus sp. V4I3 TaxID=3042305 RepID=UPI002786F7A9|nr:hypothetical protein [Paenibacillus sp. V4I3]MDQ0876744.1 cation transport ATPase [Paenibacillus sp. V4I3]
MSNGSDDWSKAYTEWATQDRRERLQQSAQRQYRTDKHDQVVERTSRIQEEFRKSQLDYEEKKKQEELLRINKEAEKIANEEQKRRIEIETNLENSRYGLVAACVIASVLVLLLITNAQALGVVVTIILFIVFVFFMFRNSTNPFLPGPLLLGLPVFILVSLPMFIGMWWLAWVIIVLMVGIPSYFTLQKYKKLL